MEGIAHDGGSRNITGALSGSGQQITVDRYVSHPYSSRVSKARVEVQMPADVREMLRVLSERQRQTASEWIRQAIVAAHRDLQTGDPDAVESSSGSGQRT